MIYGKSVEMQVEFLWNFTQNMDIFVKIYGKLKFQSGSTGLKSENSLLFYQYCSRLFEQLKTTCSFINIVHACLDNIVDT